MSALALTGGAKPPPAFPDGTHLAVRLDGPEAKTINFDAASRSGGWNGEVQLLDLLQDASVGRDRQA